MYEAVCLYKPSLWSIVDRESFVARHGQLRLRSLGLDGSSRTVLFAFYGGTSIANPPKAVDKEGSFTRRHNLISDRFILRAVMLNSSTGY